MIKQIIYFVLFVLVLPSTGPLLGQAASAVNPAAAGMSVDRLQRLSDYVTDQIEAGKLHGGVCMIMRKGHLAHQATYGYKDLEGKASSTMDQIFYIQSMTKPIVSVAFMMLYEEGHFFLNDPVSKYLPQFKDMKVAVDVQAGKDGETEDLKKPITIAHLLSHTAGLSHGLGGTALDKDYARALYRNQHKNIEERVMAMTELPLIGRPGEQWYYSASPDVLALLIEHFSGMSCAEFLQDRLFDPLGMDDTGYNVPKEKQTRMTQLHNYDKEQTLKTSSRQTPMEGNTIYGGTHGLFSTASDYVKFAQMMLNDGSANGHQFLSRKTVELMTVNHIGDLNRGGGEGFGLGFGVRKDLADGKSLGSVGQFYWGGAYNTYFFIDPEEHLVAVLMMQFAPFSNFYNGKFNQLVYQAIAD